jgi:ethanolamine-phosphate cytidylyltransferase
VNRVKGHNFPLQNLNERVLSVLGCRFVDNVLLDAPYEICSAMINTLKIKKVVVCNSDSSSERFDHPRHAGILEAMDNPSTFRLDDLVQRILDNEAAFQTKYERKMQAEEDFLNNKYGRNVG